MNTDTLPQHQVNNDPMACDAPTAQADTDPSGEPGPTIDEPVTDEPEWYPPRDTACM